MANLLHLHEPGLLHNVLCRYKNGIIYTYTGPILIALNPYQVFEHLYNTTLMKRTCARSLAFSCFLFVLFSAFALHLFLAFYHFICSSQQLSFALSSLC